MKTINIPDGNGTASTFTLSASIESDSKTDQSANIPAQNRVLGNLLNTGSWQNYKIVLIERMERVDQNDTSGWRVWLLPLT